MNLKKNILILSVVLLLIVMCCYTFHNNTQLNIYATIVEYSLKDDIDKKNTATHKGVAERNGFLGSDELLKKINYFIQKDEPIVFTMVGFPYKSSNTRDKVLVSSVDAAERFSLEYLQNFLSDIKKNYSPGALLYIFTDGIVFCDLEDVSDESVIKYEDDLKVLAQDFTDIKIVTMRDLCQDKTVEEIRSLICARYPSEEEFQQKMNIDKKIQNDIDACIDMMRFELALLSLTDDEIAEIGQKETHRGLQFNNFLAQFRPVNAISCSVRYQKDIGKKIGLKLSDSDITPWHGILVVDNDGVRIDYLKNVDHYRISNKSVQGLELAYAVR